jgi:hypothetical protein
MMDRCRSHQRGRWGSRIALVAAVSHFLKLDADLEVPESRRSAGMTEDEVYAL